MQLRRSRATDNAKRSWVHHLHPWVLCANAALALMDISGNIERSRTLLFSECGGYLVTDIPAGRFDRVGAKLRLLAHDLSTKESFAVSKDVDEIRDIQTIHVQSRRRYMYISGYSRRGRVFARRWDLKNPAIVEEQQLGLLPESYARSELYSHTSILFAQHYIRAVLITTNSWVNNNPYRYRQSENGLLLSQGSGWKGHWKTLEISNFTFNRQLSDYELLGPLPFKCRHIAEESDWLTNGRSRRLKSETLWNQSSYFLDSEEKLTRKQCHALEDHTTFMLLGEGPWVEPRIKTFLHWPSGIFDEYRLFRWTMDYYRNTAVVHRRGLMDGVLGKDYYFREKKVR